MNLDHKHVLSSDHKNQTNSEALYSCSTLMLNANHLCFRTYYIKLISCMFLEFQLVTIIRSTLHITGPTKLHRFSKFYLAIIFLQGKQRIETNQIILQKICNCFFKEELFISLKKRIGISQIDIFLIHRRPESPRMTVSPKICL